jgi:hypothetical protein
MDEKVRGFFSAGSPADFFGKRGEGQVLGCIGKIDDLR